MCHEPPNHELRRGGLRATNMKFEERHYESPLASIAPKLLSILI